MRISLVISTYENPGHLRRALASHLGQRRLADEILIADDGSGESTRAVVREARANAACPMRHLRHEHRGWRKCRILNHAIRVAKGDYLVFTDGDCLAPPGWLAMHERLARPKRYLAGGDVRLPQHVTDAITLEHVRAGRATDLAFLRSLGYAPHRQWLKLALARPLARALDLVNGLAPARWSGSNASTFRANLVEINGFEERFTGWGKEDVELGLRLKHAGIRPSSIRYAAPTLHMEHPRTYLDEAILRRNVELLGQTAATRAIRAQQGLQELGDDVQIDP